MISLNLPVIVQYPLSSKTASSPVCSHNTPAASRTMTSFVFSELFQYPACNWYPAMQSSPRSPTGRILPSRSTILADAWGITVPTVVRRLDMASSVKALKQVGDASVSPYDEVNSVMPNLLTSNSIRYRGTGAPAIMPVRRVQLKSSGSASNRESNMAGTP